MTHVTYVSFDLLVRLSGWVIIIAVKSRIVDARILCIVLTLPFAQTSSYDSNDATPKKEEAESRTSMVKCPKDSVGKDSGRCTMGFIQLKPFICGKVMIKR